MKYTFLAGVSAIALGFISPAMAGSIILTGHDNDFHCNAGNEGNACTALGAELAFVRAGSTLPVLTIDDGSELVNSVSGLGIPFHNVSVGAVTAGLFNHSVYSAFVVASVSTCGGCDNPPGSGTAIAAFASSINSFFNAGGGILGLAGASDGAAYAYVPDSAGVPVPIFNSSGFVTTAAGATIPGFFAVNGDQTHNTFSDPGTGGVSAAYKVAEIYDPTGSGSGPAVTLFTTGTIVCTPPSSTKCHIISTPEPFGLSLLGAGLFGLGLARSRRRRA